MTLVGAAPPTVTCDAGGEVRAGHRDRRAAERGPAVGLTDGDRRRRRDGAWTGTGTAAAARDGQAGKRRPSRRGGASERHQSVILQAAGSSVSARFQVLVQRSRARRGINMSSWILSYTDTYRSSRMTAVERVADVLGGKAVLKRSVRTWREIEARSTTACRNARCRSWPAGPAGRRGGGSLVYRVVPIATFKRRTRLTPEESARTERLARIVALAEALWEEREDARGVPEPAASAAGRSARRSTSAPPSSARGASSNCCTMSTTASRSDAAFAPTASARAAIRSSTAPARPPAMLRGGTRAAGASSTRPSTTRRPCSRSSRSSTR